MGSKKHKKHKSERREKYEERQFSLERPPSLKLILKVGGGNNSTPEHGNDSPAYGIHSELSNTSVAAPGVGITDMSVGAIDGGSGGESNFVGTSASNDGFSAHIGGTSGGGGAGGDGNYPPEKHKKSKKKKKKKDREKRHKHHHKEKRRHRGDDSSQEDMSIGEDSSQQLQETILRYSNVTATNSLANSPVTKPMIPMKSPTPERQSSTAEIPISPLLLETPSPLMSLDRSPTMNSHKSSTECLKSPASDTSGREPRTCVLKLKQSKSPVSKLLDHLLRALEKKDPHQFFAWPVTDDIAPGYSSIISDPMDFLSIRQKVDENEYLTLQEFADDFRLMCNNAISYNHVETIYHKAAKRLLHIGNRMLQPDQLLRSLRPLMMYMRELTPRELGFDLAQTENAHQNDNDSHIGDSADEGASTGAEELNSAQQEEEEKRKAIRRANNPTTRFEAFVDDLTAEEVSEQVQNASKVAKKRTIGRPNASKMGFLRQNKDGTTSMKILVDNNNDCPERVISVGAFTGKLQQGTAQLQGFREDRRNAAKIVKPINYGAYCSFAPIYDSRFSNLSKEESELVLNTYGDDTATEYAGSIMEFSKDSSYASTLANGLLDILTYGEHRKTLATLMENQRQRYEQYELDQCLPVTITDDEENENKKYENIPIDFDSLRSLGDIGVDMSFLNGLEEDVKSIELAKKLQDQLMNNSSLIERLQQVQTERLSQPLPQHLAHVARPGTDEIELAHQLTSNLTEMAKQLPPDSITSPHALRKAMGISNVGLEPIVPQRLQMNNIIMSTVNGSAPNTNNNNLPSCSIIKKNVDIVDTTSVPMDLEPEEIHHHSTTSDNNNNNNNRGNGGSGMIESSTPSVVSQADIENELREFLESGGSTTEDPIELEQMLMD